MDRDAQAKALRLRMYGAQTGRLGDMKMESVTKMFIRARESVVRNTRGQTMTEYALILAAIAVVVYGT